MSKDAYKVISVELNSDGVKALLKSDEVREYLEAVASQNGEIDSSFVGVNRCNVRYVEND